MLEISRRLLVLEHYRVPCSERPSLAGPGPLGHVVHAVRRLHSDSDSTASLCWLTPDDSGVEHPVQSFHLEEAILHARLVPDEVVAAWLSSTGTSWRRLHPLTDAGGDVVGAVWQDAKGGLLLPFDPDEVLTLFWSEGYAGAGRGLTLRAAAAWAYYRVRPVLSRRTQLALRRTYARVQARNTFPRWPIEHSLHWFHDRVLTWTAQVTATELPYIGFWPDDFSWAVVLTHDVETAEGVRLMPVLRDIELQHGLKSSWNFVPLRYDVPDGVLNALRDDGFEVGLHGLWHDGRDLESAATLAQRLPQMRHYADKWGAVGFRSPSTQRSWDLMRDLPFDYDSSYPDSDPYEPQPGGCGSWVPFVNGDLVELPITMPQDHTLFEILRHDDATVWLDKAFKLRAAGGMVLVLTHPDYAESPALVQAYRRLLEDICDEGTAWHALPREVSDWWRRRAATHIVPSEDGWRTEGPGAEQARLRYVRPSGQDTEMSLSPRG